MTVDWEARQQSWSNTRLWPKIIQPHFVRNLETLQSVWTLLWPIDFCYQLNITNALGDLRKDFFLIRNVRIYPNSVRILPYAPVLSSILVLHDLITRKPSKLTKITPDGLLHSLLSPISACIHHYLKCFRHTAC